ncbi:LpxI family protein [Roseomonas elaeocarpi]|uniref:LpxI family protein n=1 Tax=Roseomonas elaeocarpi TaxID=907779 RepID=A0ABV6JR55_9PROT
MSQGSGPLGLFAGGGELPLRVAAAARQAGREVRVVLLQDFALPADWAGFPSLTLRLGALGSAIPWLREQGVRQLVLAGNVRRPSFLALRPDAASARYIARIGMRAFSGDDGLLKAVRRVLEEEGFILLGAQALLHDIQVPPGLLTRAAPSERDHDDIRRGVAVVRSLGQLDVGQAAVVQQGLVLGVEGVEGTDALIRRCGELRRDGGGGVVVKLVKPSQDRSLDMPTIGPETVEATRAAGLSGIAFEAGGTLLLNRDATVAAADRHGIFLLSLSPDGNAP